MFQICFITIYPLCRVGKVFEPGKPGGVPHGNFNLLLTGEHDLQIQIRVSLLTCIGSKIRHTYHAQRRHITRAQKELYISTVFFISQ